MSWPTCWPTVGQLSPTASLVAIFRRVWPGSPPSIAHYVPSSQVRHFDSYGTVRTLPQDFRKILWHVLATPRWPKHFPTIMWPTSLCLASASVRGQSMYVLVRTRRYVPTILWPAMAAIQSLHPPLHSPSYEYRTRLQLQYSTRTRRLRSTRPMEFVGQQLASSWPTVCWRVCQHGASFWIAFVNTALANGLGQLLAIVLADFLLFLVNNR